MHLTSCYTSKSGITTTYLSTPAEVPQSYASHNNLPQRPSCPSTHHIHHTTSLNDDHFPQRPDSRDLPQQYHHQFALTPSPVIKTSTSKGIPTRKKALTGTNLVVIQHLLMLKENLFPSLNVPQQSTCLISLFTSLISPSLYYWVPRTRPGPPKVGPTLKLLASLSLWIPTWAEHAQVKIYLNIILLLK